MPASDHIARILFFAIGSIDRILATRAVLSAEQRAKVDALLVQMAAVQSELDAAQLSPPGPLPVPSAILGELLGQTWASRLQREIEISTAAHFFQWLRRQKPAPTIFQAACELTHKPELTPSEAVEFWGQLWQGSELDAIDADEAARAEFWSSFREGAQAQWDAWREIRRELHKRNSEFRAQVKQTLVGGA